MASNLTKILLGGLILGAGVVIYRVAPAKPSADFHNYAVGFTKLAGWRELPHNPNTLLLMQDPKTHSLLRCSATQVVSDINPEPDMDTVNIVKRVVTNARENQPEWTTEHLSAFDNGKVQFELFRKRNKNKTIIGAMAVRGNTTLLVSLSGTDQHAKPLAEGKYQALLDFLGSIDLQVTDKWEKLHAGQD